MKNILLGLLYLFVTTCVIGQKSEIRGIVRSGTDVLDYATVSIFGTNILAYTDIQGVYHIKELKAGKYKLQVLYMGYVTQTKDVVLHHEKDVITVDFELEENGHQLNEIVVTGTMKEVSKMNSPIPIEVYTAEFFRRNPTPNLFSALENINGVRPQLNCNVCNTGDIHINGMEGPYTMVMIDGMPIVSSLSTVYGLMGIPNSLVQRIEVVKGPASTLYGSEAVGGLINVITKNPKQAMDFAIDVNSSNYQDLNIDIAKKLTWKNVTSLLSANAFHFNKRWDINQDNFTDVTLQKRLSLFNKWHISRKNHKESTFAIRHVWEDRWGGELQYTPVFRLSDSLYAESITTNRIEVIGKYDLPTIEKFRFAYSFNSHKQNSAYGIVPYDAKQNIFFTQLTWDKSAGKHDLLSGIAYRYTFYDDNTPVTESNEWPNVNKPSRTHLPGIFVQDEISLVDKSRLLIGLRYDYNSNHGNIFSQRVNYKWSPNEFHTLRLGYGNGFRVANVFSEDHAALTGARQVIIAESLKPEKSHNINVNHTAKWFPNFGVVIADASIFYTYFTNRIVADYFTDANKIYYNNLDGHGITKGATLNLEMTTKSGFKALVGGTINEVYTINHSKRNNQVQTPLFTGTWSFSYDIPAGGLTFDYTGTIYSPMLLPVVPNDFRPENSPWFSLQNLQVTKRFGAQMEIYGGIKNLLNFVPNDPILRPFDPFDKQIHVNNPNGFTFDPNYSFAPMQARRVFIGFRYNLQ